MSGSPLPLSRPARLRRPGGSGRAKTVLIAGLLVTSFGASPALAQSSALMKQCADRWNAMKAAGQTGDLSFREFSQSCTSAATSPAPRTGSADAPASAPASPSARSGATQAECTARWNAMKAAGATGDLSFRQFSQSCMKGGTATQPTAPPPTASTAERAPAPARPAGRASVPSVGQKPLTPTAGTSPSPAAADDEGNDRAALERCNAQWKSYKARHDLSGAKAWHVFMANCLP